jgi:hypothetical protein
MTTEEGKAATREDGGEKGMSVEPKTVKDIDTSKTIIIENSHCKPVLSYIVNNPGCRVLDYQLHIGLHRGNPKNLSKRLDVSDCFEILTFGRYVIKKGNQFYPTTRAWVVTNYKQTFIPGLDPAPMPQYGRD